MVAQKKEFYRDFMPDVSIEEQRALTKAGQGQGFGLNLTDPFAALNSIESLSSFGEEKTTTTGKSAYSTLFGEEDQDLNPFTANSRYALPSFGSLDF